MIQPSSFEKRLFENFKQIKDELFASLQADEFLTVSLHAENSDFVRWNESKIRQNTTVEQATFIMSFIKGAKTFSSDFQCYLDYQELKRRAKFQLALMRDQVSKIPDDPFQVRPTNEGSSEQWMSEGTPLEQKIADIVSVTTGADAVGHLCSGPVVTATANSVGTFHWYSRDNFFFDYSIYNGPQAATSLYSEATWTKSGLEKNFDITSDNLRNLAKPKRELKPGKYRTYIAPAGIHEILDMFGWYGPFSYDGYKRGRNQFKKLIDGKVSLHPSINIKENYHLGLAPQFNDSGELSPSEITLIKDGKSADLLINKRSAKEYGVTANGANGMEGPRSLQMLGGTLKQTEILQKLDTGLYISNLHYLNWSDAEAARLTGMTRYACFWVEKGEVQGPIQDLRFDESLFDLWGASVEGLTEDLKTTPSILTYERRGLNGKQNPGLLVKEMNFTL